MDTTQDYEVTVSNIFEAESPEEAVKMMVAWLADWADKAGYHVHQYLSDDDGWFIDAEDLNIS